MTAAAAGADERFHNRPDVERIHALDPLRENDP